MTRSLRIEQLATAIANVRPDHPTRVAIDGVDGVGKTTLAEELVEPLERMGRQIIRASVDGFHCPRAARYRRGADSAEGYFLDSFDYTALKSELLNPLGPTGSRCFRHAVFDHRSDRPVYVQHQTAAPNAILLFDGVFLQRLERSEGAATTIVGYGTTTPQKRHAPPDTAMWDGKRRIRTSILRRVVDDSWALWTILSYVCSGDSGGGIFLNPRSTVPDGEVLAANVSDGGRNCRRHNNNNRLDTRSIQNWIDDTLREHPDA